MLNYLYLSHCLTLKSNCIFKKKFKKKLDSNQLFFIFLYCFNMLILKINFKNIKIYYFIIFPNEKINSNFI